MTRGDAEAVLARMFPLVCAEIYGGQPFTIFDGFITMRPVIVEEASGGPPNAAIAPLTETEYGVGVNAALLAIEDRTAVMFALGHEIGHGFSAVLLSGIGLAGISGPRTEVAADLGAAYLLMRLGVKGDEVKRAARAWSTSQIFGAAWSGDHPPGDHRAELVARVCDGLEAGRAFADVAGEMLHGLADYAQGDRGLPPRC
jgi:hypothetical protein